jgi:hypothetical protein
MKKERIEILHKVANGELIPEQADEQLLGLSIVGSSSLFADVDKLMNVADDKGWCFNQGMWRKDGYRSRTTYDLYAYLFIKKKG